MTRQAMSKDIFAHFDNKIISLRDRIIVRTSRFMYTGHPIHIASIFFICVA